MSSLTGSSISGTYDQLLALPSGGGNGATRVPLTDGNGTTTFSLKLSTDDISINAGDKFYFDDGGDTYIFQSSTDVLQTWVGGSKMLQLDQESATKQASIYADEFRVIAIDASSPYISLFSQPSSDLHKIYIAGSGYGADTLQIGRDDGGHAINIKGALTVGVNDTGHDVIFYGATNTKYCIWDESADSLILTPTVKLGFDGIGGHTYITEDEADNLGIWVGGQKMLELDEDTDSIYCFDDAVTSPVFTTTPDKRFTIGSTTNAHEVAYELNLAEGANNRRMKLFLDDDVSYGGIEISSSSGNDVFKFFMNGGEALSLSIHNGVVFPKAAVTNLANDGSIPVLKNHVEIDANGGARTGIRFAGTGAAGQIIIVNNTGGEKLTFHGTEGTALVRGIHADHDVMEANGVYIFISDGSLWNYIGGGVDTQPDLGMVAS
jgi:hypothetical protein